MVFWEIVKLFIYLTNVLYRTTFFYDCTPALSPLDLNLSPFFQYKKKVKNYLESKADFECFLFWMEVYFVFLSESLVEYNHSLPLISISKLVKEIFQ